MYVKLSKDLESFKLPDIVKIHDGKWINGLKKVHYGPNILSRSGGNVVFFFFRIIWPLIMTDIISSISVCVITYQDTAWSYKVRHHLVFFGIFL